MEISILQNFRKEFYSSYSYPHFEIPNCLPEKIYCQLFEEYKIFVSLFQKDKLFNNNNIRLQISADEFFQNDQFKKTLWHEFITYHTSYEFLKSIIDIFYDDLKNYFPKISFEENDLKSFGVRNTKNNQEKNFVLDCQPGINTKVKTKNSVRGPHIDNPHELIGGLFYFKDPNDNSGGDLEIFETKEKIFFHQKAEVYNLADIKISKTIKYKSNNVFFFINSPISIHSVTQRNETAYLRRLTNIIVERYIDGYNFEMKRKKNFFKNFFEKIYK